MRDKKHNRLFLFRSHSLKALSIVRFTIAWSIILNNSVTSLAFAQDDIEEVVIQAEQLDDVRIETVGSVAVLEARKLAEAGIENVEDVAAYVPNLVLTQTETGTAICIRGICPGSNQGFDQSVGIYSDGVPLPRANMARAPLLDLSSVQVLRGPQYVRDGNYSIAGSVHLISNLNTDEFSAGIDFNYIAEQNRRTLLLTGGGPIGDKFAAQAAIQVRSGDNYVKNVFREEDGIDELSARFVLGFKPTDWLGFKLKYEKGSFDTDGRNSEVINSSPTPDDPISQSSTLDGIEFAGLSNFVDPALLDDITESGAQPGDQGCRRPRVNGELANDPALWLSAGALGVDCGRYVGRLETTSGRLIIADSDVLTNADYSLEGVSRAWDLAVPRGADRNFLPATPYFSFLGLTAHEVIASQYELFGQQPLDNAGFQSVLDAAGLVYDVQSLPIGFLDTTANFSRSVDVEEFSKNDLDNITLNIDIALADVEVDFVASRVEYDFDERLDADFMPVPWFTTNQQEDFRQDFFKLSFQTSSEAFISVGGGISYLDSELIFDDDTRANATPSTVPTGLSQAQVQNILFFDGVDANPNDGNNIGTVSGNPFVHYLIAGSFSAPNALALANTFINRRFEQDESTFSAYVDVDINWNENITTTVGARFTDAKKKARRELCIDDTELGDLDYRLASTNSIGGGRNLDALQVIEFFYYGAFGVQIHCDHQNQSLDYIGNRPVFATQNGPLVGTRNEHVFLPSISTEWAVNDSWMLQAAIKTGAKLGGFDARSLSTPEVSPGTTERPDLVPILGSFEFEGERALTYELGGTAFMPNGQLSATLFYTNYKNLQTSRSDGRIGQNVGNAGEAVTQGFEIEGQFFLTEKFSTQFSLARIDFEFKDFGFGQCHIGRRPDHFFIPVGSSDTDATPGQLTSNQRLSQLGIAPVADNSFVPIIYPDSGDIPSLNYTAGDWFDGVTAPINSDPSIQYLSASWETQASTLNNLTGTGLFDPTGRIQERVNRQSLFGFNGRGFGGIRFCDFSGQTNQYVAEWQGKFTFDYKHEMHSGAILHPTVDVLYNSGYHTALNQDPRVYQNEFIQFNVRIAIESPLDTWEIALVGENITNEVIVGNSTAIPATAFVQGAPAYAGFVRSPRSLGVNFRYDF